MLYNSSNYTNFLSTTKLTYNDVIASITRFPPYAYPPKVSDNPSYEVEAVESWGTYLRSGQNYPAMIKMVDAFHDYIRKFGRIPSQYEFAEHYYRYAMDSITKFFNAMTLIGRDRNALVKALYDRCYRSYPSFVRDIEFALLLRDRFNMNVVYNKHLDTDMGIDIMYTGASGTNYGIHLFTNTARARKFREKKDLRHDVLFENVIEVDYVMDMNKTPINGYILYDETDARQLISLLSRAKDVNKKQKVG